MSIANGNTKYVKSRYTFLWSDYQPDFDIEKNINSFIKYPNIDWNQVKNIIMVSRKNKIYCYHSNQDLKNDRERGKLLLSDRYFNNLIKELEKNYNKCQKLFKKLKNIDYSKISDRKLYDLLEEITNMWSLMISFFRFSQAEGTYYLTEELKKYVSAEEVFLLMLSSGLDVVNSEQIDWQKLAKKPFSEKNIIKYVYKYPWIVSVHFTYEDVIETLKQRYNYDKNNLQEIDIETDKLELKNKQDGIIKRNPQIKKVVKKIQRVALARIEVKSCWAGTDFYLIPIFKEISKRTKEDVQDICKYYFIKEVGELLFNGKRLKNDEKIARDKCFLGIWKNKQALYFSGDKAEKIAEAELGNLYQVKNKNEFKGSVANPGNTKGVVRVLNAGNINSIRKVRKEFEKGEILVTEMTQPNIVDIASKSAAIITDEGGMLSHAAIISRELKIPCIVGTHFATTILKDGDLVEVDAERGIVKILKRTK